MISTTSFEYHPAHQYVAAQLRSGFTYCVGLHFTVIDSPITPEVKLTSLNSRYKPTSGFIGIPMEEIPELIATLQDIYKKHGKHTKSIGPS